MPAYHSDCGGTRYRFDDLARLLAAATPPRRATCWPASRRQAPSSASRRARRWPTCRCRPSSTSWSFPTRRTRSRRLIVDSHDARGLRADRAPDRRRLPRMAAAQRDRRRRASPRSPRAHARDGRRGLQADAQPGSDRGRAQDPGGHRLPQHASACPGGWRCGCSPTIRPTIPPAIAASMLDGLLMGAATR